MNQADQERRIDYIEFLVADVAAAKRFYSGVFGWTFTDYGPNYTSFHDGRLGGGFQGGETVRPGGPLVVIYTGNLEAMETSVRAAGGRIVRPTFSFPGGRRFRFADLSGHELAVWSDR